MNANRTIGLLAGLLILGFAIRSQAEAPAVGPLDRKVLDQRVYTALKEVINKGAAVYNNSSDPASCYYMWQGSLTTLQPMLDHRPELQKTIQTGLDEADQLPEMRKRAWRLRKVLDEVRTTVKAGDDKKPDDKKPDDKRADPKKADDKKTDDKKAAAKSLWERLGGEAKAKKIVEDWFELVMGDGKIDITRGGKHNPSPEEVEELKKKVVAQLSSASGGPLKYEGKSMKEVHKGMEITTAEFDLTIAHLKKALENNGIKKTECDELVKIVEATRADIVEKK